MRRAKFKASQSTNPKSGGFGKAGLQTDLALFATGLHFSQTLETSLQRENLTSAWACEIFGLGEEPRLVSK
jgi:hypothetical protein